MMSCWLRRIYFLGLILVCVVGCRPQASAQSLTGSIEGTIRDEQESLIAGAEVTVTQTGTGQGRTLATNESGSFRFEQLPIGAYKIAVTKTGFKRVATDVQVTLGSPITLNLALPVGAVNEVVDVTAGTPIEVSNVEVSRNVQTQTINDLPVLSRNPAVLLQLFPGVPAVIQDKNGSFTVGGLRPRSTTYNVDGSNNNFEVSSGPRTPVIQEAVQEFRALTNVFSAQYGKGSGAVIDLVLKSGTNEFHGDAFIYHRNKALDATPFFANSTGTSKPPFILNIYGGTLGGPIVENKTFFFTAFQGTNLRTSNIQRLTIPSDQFRSPITNDPRSLVTNPATAQLINDVFGLLPPCSAPTPSCLFTSSQSQPSNEYIWSAKLDHQFTGKDFLTGRFLFRDFDQANNSAIASGSGDIINRDSNLAVTYRRIISSSTVNEVIFSYSRFRREIVTPNAILPDVSISGFAGIGAPSNFPQAFTNKYYQLVDNLSLVRGNHSLKLGADILHTSTVGFALFFGRGVYSFAALPGAFGAPDSLTNFRLGRAAAFQRTEGDFERAFDYWDTSFYFQDDWKVRPNLTLNLGLRYDLQLPPSIYGVNSGTEGFAAFDLDAGAFTDWKADKNNFSPVVGVAWDPSGKGNLSLRAGYRLAYDRIVLDYYDIGGLLQPPFISASAVQLPQVPAIPFGNAESVARTAGLPIFLMMLPDTEVSYAHSWHMTFQKKLAPDTALEVGYLGTAGRNLGIAVAFNRIDPMTRQRPDTRFGQVALVDDIGYSNYHGLTSMIRSRLRNSLSFTASYTWSKALDIANDAVAPFGGETGGALAVATDPVTGTPRLDLEYGPAIFHRPHAFASSLVWSVPRITESSFASAILNDWQLSTIVLLQSGNPFTILAGVDLNQDGVNNDRPDVVQPGLLNRVYGNPDEVIPREGFNASPTPIRVGNLGRNVFRRDAVTNVDFAAVKRIRFTERYWMEFRTEFFNLFNHPRFSPPVNNLSSPSFGRILSQENDPRFIRFALKFHF